jgi:hypothetical protein
MQGVAKRAAKGTLHIYKCDFLCPSNLKFLSQIKGNLVKDVIYFKFMISARGGRCYSSSRAPEKRATPLITTGLLSVGLLRECGQLRVRWQCVSVWGAEGNAVTLCKCVLSVCMQRMRYVL